MSHNIKRTKQNPYPSLSTHRRMPFSFFKPNLSFQCFHSDILYNCNLNYYANSCHLHTCPLLEGCFSFVSLPALALLASASLSVLTLFHSSPEWIFQLLPSLFFFPPPKQTDSLAITSPASNFSCFYFSFREMEG